MEKKRGLQCHSDYFAKQTLNQHTNHKADMTEEQSESALNNAQCRPLCVVWLLSYILVYHAASLRSETGSYIHEILKS